MKNLQISRYCVNMLIGIFAIDYDEGGMDDGAGQ